METIKANNKCSKKTTELESKIGNAMLNVIMFLGGIMFLPFEGRPLLQWPYRIAVGTVYVVFAIEMIRLIARIMYWSLESFYTWLA